LNYDHSREEPPQNPNKCAIFHGNSYMVKPGAHFWHQLNNFFMTPIALHRKVGTGDDIRYCLSTSLDIISINKNGIGLLAILKSYHPKKIS